MASAAGLTARLLSDTFEVADEAELMDAELEEEQQGSGRPSGSSAAASPSGFVPPPPSLFAFNLRSAVAAASWLAGPWAHLPVDVLPKASLADVLRELTLRPHQSVGGVKRYSEPVSCYEVCPPAGARAGTAPSVARAKKPNPAAPRRGPGGASSCAEPPLPVPPPGSILRVPRAYFTERFGRPARDETSLGRELPERVRFEGALRDGRQRAFVGRLVHTLVELKQTIALGSAEPGCGKTVMFLYLWSTVLRRKGLVIVHGLPIVAQWVAAARRFCPEARVGIIHQDTWQVRGRDLVVASSDTLASRAEQYTDALWKEFGVVCFDEAHHIMAGTFLGIYRACMHARYCISLTGTPYRKDGLTPAMPFLTGPNAAFMKNTDPVHVRVVDFAGGRQSFVGFKFGPAAGKPNEAAMISAMVEDERRTRLLADMVRACVSAGRKVLVLCARNDLREALRLLVAEALSGTPCPHRVRILRAEGGGSAAGFAPAGLGSTPCSPLASPPAGFAPAALARPPAGFAPAALASPPAGDLRWSPRNACTAKAFSSPDADAEPQPTEAPAKRRRRTPEEMQRRRDEVRVRQRERALRAALETYDSIYMEPYRAQPSTREERRAMAARLAAAESKLDDGDMRRVLECEGLPPRVVPELTEADAESPASWIEALNAGDDYVTRMNKQQARAILATYVMAREALDVPGLDTLLLATPSSDVRQAVGRIRRTGRAGGSAEASASMQSILDVPCALVLDLTDTFQPFQQWGVVRQRYYRDERFQITRARVLGDADPWNEPRPRGPAAAQTGRRMRQLPFFPRGGAGRAAEAANPYDDDEDEF